MRKPWSIAFLTASLLLAGAPVTAATYPASMQRPLYVPGEVVVKYKPGMQLELKAAALRDLSVQEEKPLGGIPRLNVLRLPQGADVMQAVQRLEASGQVEYAEPNYYRYPTAFTVETPSTTNCIHGDYTASPTACVKPVDPLINQQWYVENALTDELHNDVGLTAAWGLFCNLSGSSCTNALSSPSKVKDFDIAIIDDGFDLTNPDLHFIAGTSCLGTSNCLPTSSTAAQATATDGTQDHGTYVASTLAALGGNSFAMSGVLWSAKIVPIKTDLSDTAIINAINYAVNYLDSDGNTVKIINESFGGPIPSLAEYDALQRAENAGILVVVSAGNSDSDNDRAQAAYPANYAAETVIFPKVDSSGNPESGATKSQPGLPNVIAVAASDDTDHMTSFSEWGSFGVGLLAPGEGVIALQRGAKGATAVVAGTSFSAPITAGVAGLVGQYLILNSNPLTPDWHDLKEHLFNGSERSQTPPTGNMDGRSATGRLNAYLALQDVTHGVIVVKNVTISGGSGDGEINPSESAFINVKIANIGADETDVKGTLSSSSSLVTIPATPHDAGTMKSPGTDQDATAVLSFPVTFNAISGNQPILLKLDITSTNGGTDFETRYFYLEAGSLSNNVTENGFLSRNVYDDFQDWHIDVPTGGKNLVIYTTTPGGVDIDLLVEENRLPQYLETIGVNPTNDPGFQQYIDPNSQSSGRADGDESVAYDGLPDQNPLRVFDPVNQPLTTPGTYHIVVVNFSGNSRQPYTLTACYAAPGSDEITFSGNYEYDEAAGKATLTLLRSGSTGAVSVAYATGDGSAYPGGGNPSATAGTNYTASQGTVNWADGSSAAKTITVPIIDTGAIVQGTFNFKHFHVRLSNPTGGAKLGCINDADVALGNPKTVIPASGGSGGSGGGGGGGSTGGKSGGGGVTDLLSLLALAVAAVRRRRKTA